MIGEGVINRLRPWRAQEHMGSGEHGDRPGEAPAVAVKQRQRPQIDGVVRHFPGDDIVDRIGPGATVRINNALGPARGSGSVVQRQRVPLIIGQGIGEGGIAFGQQIVKGELADPFATRSFAVFDIDDQEIAAGLRDGFGGHCRKLGIDQQNLRLAMFKNIGDRAGIEPRVVGVQDRPQHRQRQRTFQGLRDVRRDQGNGVAFADTSFGQCRGQPLAPLRDLTPVAADVPMDLRGQFGVHTLHALEDRNRGQRRMIGGIARQFGPIKRHSPVHSGMDSLRVKAPIPASASRAIMFSTIVRPAKA